MVLVWCLSRITPTVRLAAEAHAQRVLAITETLEANLANLSNSNGLGLPFRFSRFVEDRSEARASWSALTK